MSEYRMPALMPPNDHAAATLLLAILALIAFSRDRLPLETTSLAVLVTLVAGFHFFPFSANGTVVQPTEFFFGFGHEALVAISAFMVIGRALTTTGAFQPVSKFLGAMLKSRPRAAMLLVLGVCPVLSAVVNDTPVVVLMMPILVAAAAKAGRSPSETLLPMNYAVLMGGMATTFGTSTNLLVVSIAADLGVRKFGVFEWTHMTAIALFFGLAYLWFVLPRLLKSGELPPSQVEPQRFDVILYIHEESPAVGRTLQDIRKGLDPEVRISRVIRGSGVELMRLPSLEIESGDRLHVSAGAEQIHNLAEKLGATLHNLGEDEPDLEDDEQLQPSDERLADVVVTAQSALNGRTLRSVRFSEQHDVIVVGLHRPSGYAMRAEEDIASVVLREGDMLLVRGTNDNIRQLRADAGLLVLEQQYAVPRAKQAPFALLILGLVVLAAAFKILPIAIAALVGVLAMIVTRCIDWREAGEAVSAKIILLVASSLALGSALTKTGATDYLAQLLLAATQDASPTTILAILMTAMAVLTNFVSNNAAVSIGTPIAVGIAKQLGVSPEPLVLAILFGANFCYVTPMAYQTNLLIMSAGGYSFSDFVRCGLPLAILMLCVYAFLLPRFFPF